MKVLSAVFALLGIGALMAAILGSGSVANADHEVLAAADPEPAAPAPAGPELVTRLADLEARLPVTAAPSGVEVDPSATWGRLEGDAGGTRQTLDAVERDLRQLFVEADEAGGPAGDAVALVARGWLDVWSGLAPLAAWESHDLEFPRGTGDQDGVATGGDELRGAAERGLEQVLRGRDRLRQGYGALRELGTADAGQGAFDVRAADEDVFEARVRPLLLQVLSRTSPTVIVTTERFVTQAPGSQARARSSTIMCVDRDALAALDGRPLDEEALAALSEGSNERVDCPQLPVRQPTP